MPKGAPPPKRPPRLSRSSKPLGIWGAMRNAGETVRVASACELSADMPPTPQRTISISRAQGFSCVSCRVRFARAPLFFWLFLHLSTSSSWTRSRRAHSSSRCRIFGSSTDDWPARGQTGLGLGLACPPPFLLTGLFSSRSKSRSSRATYSPVCPKRSRSAHATQSCHLQPCVSHIHTRSDPARNDRLTLLRRAT